MKAIAVLFQSNESIEYSAFLRTLPADQFNLVWKASIIESAHTKKWKKDCISHELWFRSFESVKKEELERVNGR